MQNKILITFLGLSLLLNFKLFANNSRSILNSSCTIPVQLQIRSDISPNCTMILAEIDFLDPSLHDQITSYEWYKNDELISSNETITHFATSPGRLEVRFEGVGQDGCTYVGVLEVDFVECNCACDFTILPSIISPNGDGNNDKFGLFYPRNSCSIDDFSLKIVNRWGNSVYESEDPDEFWDGTYNDNAAPSDVYTFGCTFRIGVTDCRKTGHFTLIR